MDDPNFVKKDLNDESLANVPPVPAKRPPGSLIGSLFKGVAIVGAAGAALLVLVFPALQPCRGATRSAKLKWQERQAVIDEAQRNAQANADFKS